MSTSVSHFSETDFKIRFAKTKNKLTKRMSRFVSEKCETDVDIHFIKKQKKIMKRMSISFHIFLKRILTSVI